MAAPLHLDMRAAFPDDLVEEILVRFPPDDPSCLLRASLVCKPWSDAASGPAILRRLHELHGAPPVLGFLHNSNGYPRFVPAIATPFSLPLPDRRFWRILDCRHGRALFISASGEGPRDLLLWEPITGYQRRLPAPSEHSVHFVNAAVLCAADGCDHRACHGGPFRVLFTGINEETQRLAWMYSSQTGTWGDPTTMEFSPDVEDPAVLVGSSYLYFVNSRLGFILEYDMAKHRLKILLSPPLPEYWSFDRRIVLMPAGNGGLGDAMAFESRLCLWQLEDAGAQWVQTRVIDLAKLLPIGAADIESLQKSPNAVGFAHGANTIFVSTVAGIFTIELHSERVRKVCNDCPVGPLIPVVSFYTPGCKLQTQVGVGVGKEEKAIKRANDLLYKGSKAFKEGDFVDAVDCLGHAHKIMVACYGRFAPECVSTYYKYGYALLRKAQDATVSLCNVPKTESSEKPVKNTTTNGYTRNSKTSSRKDEDPASSEECDSRKGDQAHSDLVFAMEMFSLARAIVEKSPENTMQKVKILFAQADVYLEHKGHLDSFLGLYFKALSILTNLVEPDHPRMVELHFRICFVLELGSMPEDGIPYCEHAISLCKSHTEKLKNNLETLLVDNNVSAAERSSEKSALEDEIEFFTSILPELNKKYEELVRAMSIPSLVVDETVNRKSRPGRVSGKLSMLCQEMQLSEASPKAVADPAMGQTPGKPGQGPGNLP